MLSLVENVDPLEFFDDFRELSQSRTFACDRLGGTIVELTNPVCGDVVRLSVGLQDGRLVSFGYQQRGCWPVSGCLELLGQLCREASVDQVLLLRFEDFIGLVRGVPASKRHAFSLTHRALLQAVSLSFASAPSQDGVPS